jgi:hypothetical protein
MVQFIDNFDDDDDDHDYMTSNGRMIDEEWLGNNL